MRPKPLAASGGQLEKRSAVKRAATSTSALEPADQDGDAQDDEENVVALHRCQSQKGEKEKEHASALCLVVPEASQPASLLG